MEFRKNDILELQITDMGTDGEGIGRISTGGIPFFVNGAVIGDDIRASITKMKPAYGYARLIEVVQPSLWRVEPLCPLAKKCGGCQIQQVDYTKQLEYKQNKVKNCLERIGGLKNISYEPIIGMESPWYYRNKAQFPLSRNKKEGTISIGFYAGHTHTVIDTRHCFIQAEIMQPILEVIRRFLQDYQISIYEEDTGKGLVRHILLRVGFSTGEVMVCLVLNGDKLPYAERLEKYLTEVIREFNQTHCTTDPCENRLEETSEQYEQMQSAQGKQTIKYCLASFCININRDRTNVILGEQVRVLSGKAYITDRIGDMVYRISPLSFYQVNPVQTRVIYDKVKEYSALTGNEIVWDLYCGTGTIGLYLAKKAKKVYGIEIVREAIEDARINAKENGLKNTEFYTGAAEELAPELLQNGRPDIIIVDPPRKGCDPALLDTLLAAAPQKIIYVSCDPATLARDLKVLNAGGYQILSVQPVDAFCHSGHVETVVLLSKLKSTHPI